MTNNDLEADRGEGFDQDEMNGVLEPFMEEAIPTLWCRTVGMVSSYIFI